VLFAIIFVWTPPHFWALALKYRDDYEAADVPMLPVKVSFARTARQIVVYSVLLLFTSLLFGAVGGMGLIYWSAALTLGAGFVAVAVRLQRSGRPERAMSLFGYSITYLTLLFAAMAADALVRTSL
jgi:protoheme IX farnesyltransferase